MRDSIEGAESLAIEHSVRIERTCASQSVTRVRSASAEHSSRPTQPTFERWANGAGAANSRLLLTWQTSLA
jgi:hypothetical protein